MPRAITGCAVFQVPGDQGWGLGNHALVPTLAHRSNARRLLEHILLHPKDMGGHGSSTTAELLGAHSQLLLGRPFQTMERVGLDISAIARLANAHPQLLLRMLFHTMDRGGLGI